MAKPKKPMLKIHVEGINDAMKYLDKQMKKKDTQISSEVAKQGFFMIGEVMQSIAGRKSEPTSVDTGRFMASVPINSDISKKNVAYIKSDLNYAAYLEKGARGKAGRHHFENSLDRNKNKIREAIKKAALS